MISHTIPAAGVAGLIKTALVAAPPRAAADARRATSRTRSSGSRRTPFYLNTETRPVDPRRRRAAPRRRQRVRLRRHQRARRARGVRRRGRRRPDHRPPWDSEVVRARGRRRRGAGRRRPASWPRALEPRAGVRARRPRLHARAARSARVERPGAAGDRRDLARRPARRSSTSAVDKLRKPDVPAHQGRLAASTTPREPLGARRARSCSSSPARARSTRACSPTCACTSTRCARSFDRDRPPLRRPPARRRAQRLGVPAPRVLRRGAPRRRGAPDAARHRRRVRADRPTARCTRCCGRLRAARRRDRSATAPASTRPRWSPACSTSTPTSASSRSRQGLYRAYADASARHDIPRRGAAGARHRRASSAARDRATRPAASSTWRWTTARTRPCWSASPRRSPRARDLAAAKGDLSSELPVRPRRPHAAVRAVRRGPARGLRGAAASARRTTPLWSCTTAAPYPADEAGDPRAARRALDEPGRASARRSRRCTTTARACSSRCGPRGNMTAFVEDILRGRPSCAVPRRRPAALGHHPAQPPRRRARRPRRRASTSGTSTRHRGRSAPRLARCRRRGVRVGSSPCSLATSWPMLRLDDDAVERVRAGRRRERRPTAARSGAGRDPRRPSWH